MTERSLQVVSAKSLSKEHFEREFLDKKIPVIVKDCIDDWRCCKDWVVTGNHVNVEFFRDHFGSAVVPVIDQDDGGSSGKHSTMTIKEFCSDAYWERDPQCPERFIWRDGNLRKYLKDWHFWKACPEYEAPYTTPMYFKDDWLNFWFDTDESGVQEVFGEDFASSDYRFVYLGCANTFTPVHTDVMKSNSWSAQLCGRKQWKLLDPKYAFLVENRDGICGVDAFHMCPAVNEHVKTCIQYPGEILFVPSCWYHEVKNLDVSLSINHNWIDSASLTTSWEYLLKEYSIATRMIEDCRNLTSEAEFDSLVDRNVLLNCGMNKKSFLKMVSCGLKKNELSPRQTTNAQEFLKKFSIFLD